MQYSAYSVNEQLKTAELGDKAAPEKLLLGLYTWDPQADFR